ncbi:MAG: FAD:protein FMN transferase [bacterium]
MKKIFVILMVGLLFMGCGKNIQKKTEFLMDTYVSIIIPGDKSMLVAMDKGFKRMEEVSIKFNVLNPKSPFYDFNMTGKPVEDPECVALVSTALKVAALSDGALDITVKPVVDLWGFYSPDPHVPDKAALKKALAKVGYKNLLIKNGKLIKLKEGVQLDLGAIAKGYAVGEAMKVLKAAGVKSALIDAGGDIYAIGKNGKDRWKIGIKNPRADGLLGGMEIDPDITVATSGDYERFFEKDGIRYCHIFDPKTGYPAKSGTISVSVITDDATLADAWSTAFFVMGKDKTAALVKKIGTVETIMVADNETISYSPGLAGGIENQEVKK